MKAVFLDEACFLPSASSRNHGSSSLTCSEVFCVLCCFAYREKSFTCCRPLGNWPELEHFEIPPISFVTVVYTTSRGVILSGALFSSNFVLSHVRTYVCDTCLEFLWGCGMIGCSVSPLNKYWTKQNLWSSPVHTINKKIKRKKMWKDTGPLC